MEKKTEIDKIESEEVKEFKKEYSKPDVVELGRMQRLTQGFKSNVDPDFTELTRE